LLTEYGGWQGETRRKHRGRVLDRLGWRLCGAGERKLLDEFLPARALEHDAPGVLLLWPATGYAPNRSSAHR
jgi:hypothetical protein